MQGAWVGLRIEGGGRAGQISTAFSSVPLPPLKRHVAEYKSTGGKSLMQVSRRPDSLSLMETRRILARLRWKKKKKQKAQVSLPFNAELALTQQANTKNVQPGGVL